MYLQMEVNKAFATVGEELLYTIHIGNDEAYEIRDVCLMDDVIDGLKLVKDSIKIANRYIIGDFKKGIQIGVIPIGETQTITFKMSVEKIPEYYSITNIVDVAYRVSNETAYMQSNTVITIISDPCISQESGGILLSVNKEIIDIGESVIYTAMLTNKGNVPAKNIRIEGIKEPIQIDSLEVSETYVMEYEVTYEGLLDTFAETKQLQITYEFALANRQVVRHTYASNACVVTMQTATFDKVLDGSRKKASLTQCTLGEEITYTLILTNQGNQTAQKMWYEEPIPQGSTWVTDSLKMDGLVRRGECIADGISLTDIGAHQSTVIEYKIKVNDALPYPNPIGVCGTLSYTYEVNEKVVNAMYEVDAVMTEVQAAILATEGDLGCKIEVSDTQITLNQVIEGQIILYNSGNQDAEKLSMSIDIPSYMKWEGAGWSIE
ncbi:MAG: hypothetical protein ACRCTE_13725, partial [Cellulosilyticaceae bacterium]